jgi:hypothetical protein
MGLDEHQLETILSKTREVYEATFGQEVTPEQLLEAVERELDKRKLIKITDRLCNQRADKDLVSLHALLSKQAPKKKSEKKVAPTEKGPKPPRKTFSQLKAEHAEEKKARGFEHEQA